jgi:hypothetical protein
VCQVLVGVMSQQREDCGLCIFRAQRRETHVLSSVEKLHAQNISVNRTDSVMFATRRVTAEILSIVGPIRHEFTSVELESFFREAYRKF